MVQTTLTNFSTTDTAHKFQKENFINLNKTGVFELSIYLLYMLGKLPEYRTISNLMMLNTQNAFMRICEYFGGQTITIPTIEDVQDALMIIKMYNDIDIGEMPYEQFILLNKPSPDIIVGYNKLKTLLDIYGIQCTKTEEKKEKKDVSKETS